MAVLNILLIKIKAVRALPRSPRGSVTTLPLGGAIWCPKLYIRYLAYTKELFKLASFLTMGIHANANGFIVDLMRPHYVLHNRSKDLPICCILTLKTII